MSVWFLTYEGFQPEQERLREALTTLGNGYVATRGAPPEASANEFHYPGTYLAGGYNRLKTDIAGRTIENEDLVNLPNWLAFTFRIGDGDWFDLRDVHLDDYRVELDMRRAVLTRQVVFTDSEGRRTTLTQRRFVSQEDQQLAGLQTTVEPHGWSGTVHFRSGLDGNVVNAGVPRYADLAKEHLRVLRTEAVGDEAVLLLVETTQSHLRVAEVARTRVLDNGGAKTVERDLLIDGGYIGHEFALDVADGRQTTVEKIVALVTSRDRAIAESALEAQKRAHRAGNFTAMLREHVLAWDQTRERFTLNLEADERVRRICNLHIFHLLQTVSAHTLDLDVGVPARGWHGEAYRGHIFWDELFILPFINLRMPVLTRALLMYRWRRLEEARHHAREAGFEGAMYPWQTGSDGREETQVVHLNPKSGRWLPDNSHLQRHINVAIAYNVWEYFEATGDLQFLRFHGAEMLLEIARFLSSLATFDRARDRYEICQVMGPDEYHDAYPDRDEPGLDNNAYTNIMTVWVLLRALEVLEVLPDYHARELTDHLGITRAELDRWEDISRKMFVPFHGDGIISQFEHYERLEEFDWHGYRQRYGDIHRLDRILEAEDDTPNRYKVSKQADVLMLFYLLSADELRGLLERLGYPFDGDLIPRNVDYYLQRTSHGSTLSKVVHAWVLARTDRPRSWTLFKEALEADVADVQGGTTEEGIHLGAMAGTLDIIQRCYGGIEVRDGVLRFDPVLPDELPCLELELHYRGVRVIADVNHARLRLQLRPGPAPPVHVAFRDEELELAPGTAREFSL